MKAILTKSLTGKRRIGLLLLALGLTLSACDKGKRPYEEAESLFGKSDYASAKSKAVEVIQNAPNSSYLAQAKVLYEKLEKIEALFKTAEEAGQSDDYKKAIRDYDGILALDSKSPKALEELEKTKGIYKNKLMQESKEFIESGEYEKGIESYQEILTFARNDREAADALKETETTFSNLKQTGDEAMRHFRIYMQARGTRDYQTAEIARVKYLQSIDRLYKLPKGKNYLESRLKAYMTEVEQALEKFNGAVKEAEKAMRSGNYTHKVVASDNYNKALSDFIASYGRPEAWGEAPELLKKKIVRQWM